MRCPLNVPYRCVYIYIYIYIYICFTCGTVSSRFVHVGSDIIEAFIAGTCVGTLKIAASGVNMAGMDATRTLISVWFVG